MQSTARSARTDSRARPTTVRVDSTFVFARHLMACAATAALTACGGSVGDGTAGPDPVPSGWQAPPEPSSGATPSPAPGPGPAAGPSATPSSGAPRAPDAPAAAPAPTVAPIDGPSTAAGPVASAPGPSAPVPAVPIEPATSAKLERIDWAQSLVLRADDAALELVAGKPALVFVHATTDNPSEPKPTGDLRVFDAANVLVYQAGLTLPTDALPAIVPVEPGFSRAYSALVPDRAIAGGMRLEVRLAGGRLSASSTPRVGQGRDVEIVAVPVRIAGVDAATDPGLADAVHQITPVASAKFTTHAPYTSGAVTALPTNEDEWKVAFSRILGEINAMHRSEGGDKRRYYVGYAPKNTYGLAGIGAMRGNAAMVAGLLQDQTSVRVAALHELGHNFGLAHAPCGSPGSVDGNYPYANAALGAQGRFIWGFNLDTMTFTDPRDTSQHDLMSYCTHSIFSDYNYRKVQSLQNQVLTGATNGSQKLSASGVPEDLLLLSGSVVEDDVELSPLKAFQGVASAPPTGPYVVRITSGSGTWEQQFAVDALDHDEDRFIFAFTVPNPGPIQRLQILRNGQVLLDKSPLQRTTAKTTGAAQKTALASVDFREQGGVLRVQWDASVFAYLTITHVGVERTTLAQDLRGGSATLPVAGLPAGGSFEITLGDGLNSTRIMQAR